MTTRLPYPSDFPAFADDEDPTLVWTPRTFMGLRLPALPADESIDALVYSPVSTVRRKPCAEQTTTYDTAVPRRTA